MSTAGVQEADVNDRFGRLELRLRCQAQKELLGPHSRGLGRLDSQALSPALTRSFIRSKVFQKEHFDIW